MPKASVLPEPVGRLDEQVAALEGIADDQLLDGERLCDAAARERLRHRLRDAEIGKRIDVVLLFERLGEILRPQDAFGARRKRNLSGGPNGPTRRLSR